MRVRDLIELEAYLFGGVPERPNPVYGRDSNANVFSRESRTCVGSRTASGASEGPPQKVLEILVVDLETGKIRFEAPPDDGDC